jgi:predicted house-cleaning noncanonical NTP pyrophosphatase (MazG superfamily)
MIPILFIVFIITYISLSFQVHIFDKDDSNLLIALEKKLLEEVYEFLEAKNNNEQSMYEIADILEVIEKGKTDAIAAAHIFHYQKYSIGEVKNFLRKKDIDVR